MSRNLILLVFTLVVHWVYGQHTPPVSNFKASEYKAHQQNCAMYQASDRIMYMANSEGLLSYNGNSWTLHKTQNQKIIRSIKVVHDRIYTGSYGEIGYWTSGDCNELNYQSLTNLIYISKLPSRVVRKVKIPTGIVSFTVDEITFDVVLHARLQDVIKTKNEIEIKYLFIILKIFELLYRNAKAKAEFKFWRYPNCCLCQR